METRTISRKDVDYFTNLLTETGVSVAAVIGSSPQAEAAILAASKCCDAVIPLPTDITLHAAKRKLILYHCDCILYDSLYGELPYRVENDGVTFVEHFICLDSDETN